MRTRPFFESHLIAILFFVSVICYSSTRLIRSVLADSRTNPDQIYAGDVKFQVDLLVIKYPKNVSPKEDDFEDAARQVIEKYKFKHVIAMPDDYTPVGIPKNKFDEVKKLLGNNFFSMNNLACEKEDCLP